MTMTRMLDWYFGFAASLAEVGMNWWLQSAVLLLLGVLAAHAIRRRGPASQSMVYRMTLLAICICPFAAWLLPQVGIPAVTVKVHSRLTLPIPGQREQNEVMPALRPVDPSQFTSSPIIELAYDPVVFNGTNIAKHRRWRKEDGLWCADPAYGHPDPGNSRYRARCRDRRTAGGCRRSELEACWLAIRYESHPDGTYHLVGLPGRALVGVECVGRPYRTGVGADAIEGLDEKRQGFLTWNNPIFPGKQWPNTLVEINPDKRAKELQLDVQLDPGERVSITTVDPDGTPLSGVHASGRLPRL